ncbi:MAG: polysaccharide ABC transporter ATP-binding protein [Ferruginibacter sp.]
MSTVIKIESLSKQYRLGSVGLNTLKDDFKRWRYSVMGREDPFLTFGDENDRTTAGQSDYVWALRNINFEVKQGDVVGIIGRNGAGKSTLLKILSRTTAPTTGSIKMKGRIASLLEVGTGFHGELSGRENIYLNGAIMGMRKYEITKKLDEIIDFAGVERYIDTPVKRYSSGMYVRLAFGVAAHLEPDIMIVDEVLAVGDVEFQKKALGKMKDVSKEEGRTVLFVSHNMTAIKNLCPRTIYLKNGQISSMGDTEQVMNQYLSHNTNSSLLQRYNDEGTAPGNEKVKLKRIEVVPQFIGNSELITLATPIDIEFDFWNNVTDKEINLSIVLNTIGDECVFNVGTEAKFLSKGVHKGVCHIPGNLLNDGLYKISMMVVGERSSSLYYFEDIVNFEVNESRDASGWHGKWIGFVRPTMDFSLK